MDLCTGEDDVGKSMEVWVGGAGLGVPSPDASTWLCDRLGMTRMLIVWR